jgi:DNA-binding response OmpR family regulator
MTAMAATSDLPLAGLQALLVEDEALIAMLVEDMVEELGGRVMHTATSLAQALAAVDMRYDLAILDVNLQGELSFPVAEIIERRGTPFLFTTGYGVSGLAGTDFRVPVLQKPFMAHELRSAVAALLGATG